MTIRVTNPLRFWQGKPTATMPSRRNVAVEIEVAYYRTSEEDRIVSTLDAWSATSKGDSSIETCDGFEVNTSPASGGKFEEQLGDIARALSRANAEVTTKCGLHVHVSAYDYGYADWCKLMLLWQVVQNEAFAIMPESRQENTYCAKNPAPATLARLAQSGELSSADAKLAFLAAMRTYVDTEPQKWFYANTAAYNREKRKYDRIIARGLPYIREDTVKRTHTKRSVKAEGYNAAGGSRYYAMNVTSGFAHGTVEFRLHSGTTDYEKMRNWASWCASLVDAAKRMTFAEVTELAKQDVRTVFLSFAATEGQKEYFTARRAKFTGV